jgi:hypothetical protein
MDLVRASGEMDGHIVAHYNARGVISEHVGVGTKTEVINRHLRPYHNQLYMDEFRF